MGSVVVFIGYMLSPLSWWNDLFVNVPLALAFAWVVTVFYKPAFTPSLILGYWLTNVLGFVLMHKGAQQVLPRKIGNTPVASWPRILLYPCFTRSSL
jgi:hypothetical protein